MGPQINVLREFKKPVKHAMKEVNTDLMIGCNDCRHALWLLHGVYCALRREKMDSSVCDVCPHFDPQPLEYRLFRRM